MGAAAYLVFLATTDLPQARPVYRTPEWIGPLQLIDIDDGSIARDRALRIEQGRIAQIVPLSALSEAAHSRMIDTGGAYAVPGLWDMHAVLTRYADAVELPLQLAYGVTRLRSILRCPRDGRVNLYACPSDRSRWNAQIRSGAIAGAIALASGTYPVAGPRRRHRDAPQAFAAGTPDEARALVRQLATAPDRPDHIKTYAGVPRDSFFALMQEAARLGIEVSGHVPNAVRVSEAVSAGFKVIAHARVLPIACSSREDEITAGCTSAPRCRPSRHRCARPSRARATSHTSCATSPAIRWDTPTERSALEHSPYTRYAWQRLPRVTPWPP